VRQHQLRLQCPLLVPSRAFLTSMKCLVQDFAVNKARVH
jgi:hypothetical protein